MMIFTRYRKGFYMIIAFSFIAIFSYLLVFDSFEELEDIPEDVQIKFMFNDTSDYFIKMDMYFGLKHIQKGKDRFIKNEQGKKTLVTTNVPVTLFIDSNYLITGPGNYTWDDGLSYVFPIKYCRIHIYDPKTLKLLNSYIVNVEVIAAVLSKGYLYIKYRTGEKGKRVYRKVYKNQKALPFFEYPMAYGRIKL